MSRRRPIPASWRVAASAALMFALVVPIGVLVLPVEWGGQFGLTIVAGPSMEPTLESGDLLITRARPRYEVGDVVVFRIPAGEPGEGQEVVHRITGGSSADGYRTAGDNRVGDDPWRPTDGDIIGAHWRLVPAGGLVLLWLRSPLVLGLAVSFVVFRVCLTTMSRSAGSEPTDAAAEPDVAPDLGPEPDAAPRPVTLAQRLRAGSARRAVPPRMPWPPVGVPSRFSVRSSEPPADRSARAARRFDQLV